MTNLIESTADYKPERIGLVVSKFNQFITQNLLEGALNALKNQGMLESQIDVVWVPGAVEITPATKALINRKNYEAIIALGCVIQGGTPHFDYVCQSVTQGLTQLMVDTGIPISFGVLTTDTVEQATERSQPKGTNKGADAAKAAIEMASILKNMSS